MEKFISDCPKCNGRMTDPYLEYSYEGRVMTQKCINCSKRVYYKQGLVDFNVSAVVHREGFKAFDN